MVDSTKPGCRILIIKLSSLGDLFHVLPAAHALKTSLQARLDWVTQPEYVDVVKCFPDINRVIAFPRQSFFRDFGAFARELRTEAYDYVVDFQGLIKSGLVARLARGGARIGPSFHREGARIFYSAVAGRPDKCRHAVEENMDVLRYFGLQRPDPEFPIRFPKQTLAQTAPRVALLPVSRWPSKNWPIASFADAARRLQASLNASIFLLGGSDNVSACAEIEKALPRPVTNQAGKLTLVQTGSALAEMQLLITNDSGPMHMAAALGVPVLAVFGPTDPLRTGPFGTRHRVVSASLPCQPCFSRACRYGDVRCLAAVTPEQVVKTAVEMLGGAAS